MNSKTHIDRATDINYAKLCMTTFSSLRIALSSLNLLKANLGNENMDEANVAFYTTAVVSYAAPFCQAHGKGPIFPVRKLTSIDGFSRDIHGQLMQERNKLIAHHDIEHMNADFKKIEITSDIRNMSPIKLHMADSTCSYYINDIHKIEEYQKHIQTALNYLYSNVAQYLGATFDTPSSSSEVFNDIIEVPGISIPAGESAAVKLPMPEILRNLPRKIVDTNGFHFLTDRISAQRGGAITDPSEN